jgi:hypothetical protein
MDSDDDEEQMFAEIFEEEMAAAAQDEEHMLILSCLSDLYAETASLLRVMLPRLTVINGRHNNKGYYLADGIYPKWATFVKTISSPILPKEVKFVKAQERLSKGRRACIWCPPAKICCNPVPLFELVQKSDVGGDENCVCLHNMIIENERKYSVPLSEQAAPYEREGPLAQPNHQVPASWVAFIAMRQKVRDSTMHQLLQDDLVEHIWRLQGNTN